MARSKTSKKARRRRKQPAKRSGVFTGMRRGFKNLAGTEKQQRKKSSWLSTALTVLLLLAAIGLFFYRS